jgi:hypothetical protein
MLLMLSVFMLNVVMLQDRFARDKNSSLLGPFVSYEEIEVV